MTELPADPTLAGVASALESIGASAEVWDGDWRLAYVTDDYVKNISVVDRPVELGLGEHLLSTRMLDLRLGWPAGPTLESVRAVTSALAPAVLADAPGGLAELEPVIDERLRDVVAAARPHHVEPLTTHRVEVRFGVGTTTLHLIVVHLRDPAGRRVGSVTVTLPGVPGAVLGMLGLGDLRVFEQMLALVQPARRPAAILFADLEASTTLSRRLSTPEYFAVIRRLVRRIDETVSAHGGIVGKHAGDGVTAFFLAERAGSESAAVAAAIATARAIREDAAATAVRSGLEISDVTMRFGLHWGATIYVGRLMTAGRTEVTALGEEVNEAARIEACAAGGRILASKALLERLDPDDSAAPVRPRYVALGDITTAPEKARRDAPTLAVCEL